MKNIKKTQKVHILVVLVNQIILLAFLNILNPKIPIPPNIKALHIGVNC